jgi:hypothetical protein
MRDDQELVTVYEAYDETDAEVVKLALAGEEIPSVIDNAHQAGLTGVLQVKLQVSSADAEQARQFIRDHEASRGDIVD